MSTFEQRKNIKDRMPQVYLSKKHVKNCQILTRRESLLSNLPKNGIVAEIGVASGDFSDLILRVTTPKKFHIIDSWSSERYCKDYEIVKERFAEQLTSGLVEINLGLSTDVLPQFPDHYFDWVYIDTSHSYRITNAELEICLSKVKPQGRITGHDFCIGNPLSATPYGVIEACNEFCVNYNWEYEFITLEPHGALSFCLMNIDR